MQFEVVSAELKRVEKEGDNKNRPYLKLSLKEKGAFYRAASVNIVEFIDEDMVAEVEKRLTDGVKLPDYSGKFVIVQTSGYRVVRNAEVLPAIHHEMKLFVGLDRDGTPFESNDQLARRAERIIVESDIFVAATDETTTPTAPALPI